MANMYERLLGDSYKNFIQNYRNAMRLQKKIALLEKERWMKFTEVLFRKIDIKIASKFRMFSLSGEGSAIYNT